MDRTTTIERTTKETKINLSLNLDNNGESNINISSESRINTGIGFFDHMLNSFAKHSFISLDLNVVGDLDVDTHHTIEDTGIVLGQAIKEAVGDKKGIRRYGSAIIPMDDALVLCSLDLSGRPYLVFDLPLTVEKVGDLETEMIKEFFYAVSYSSGMNLHIKLIHGENNHHIIEGVFKAFAKAFDQAISYDVRIKDVLSTKGTI